MCLRTCRRQKPWPCSESRQALRYLSDSPSSRTKGIRCVGSRLRCLVACRKPPTSSGIFRQVFGRLAWVATRRPRADKLGAWDKSPCAFPVQIPFQIPFRKGARKLANFGRSGASVWRLSEHGRSHGRKMRLFGCALMPGCCYYLMRKSNSPSPTKTSTNALPLFHRTGR